MAETTVLKSSASPVNASPVSAAPKVATTGPLPIVQVNMNNGRPQRGGQLGGAHRNVAVGPVRGGITREGKLIQPSAAPQQLPSMPMLGSGQVAPPAGISPEQLGLCRFLVDGYRVEQLKEGGSVENAKLAEETLAAIDVALAAPIPPPPARMVVAGGPRSPQFNGVAPRRVVAAPGGRPVPPPVVVEMTNAGPAVEIPEQG